MTWIRNSSHKKIAISSIYSPGFSRRRSYSASIIGGITVRRRPTRVGGALTFLNRERLLLMLMIERLLYLVALAICEVVNDLLNIMSWIISSFERGGLGAMLRGEVWTLMEESVGRGSGLVPLRGYRERLYLLTLAYPSAQ